MALEIAQAVFGDSAVPHDDAEFVGQILTSVRLAQKGQVGRDTIRTECRGCVARSQQDS